MTREEVDRLARQLDVMAKLLGLEKDFGPDAARGAVEMWQRARKSKAWMPKHARERILGMAEVRQRDLENSEEYSDHDCVGGEKNHGTDQQGAGNETRTA